MSSPHIICFGPGPKFKGGIAQYNTALARALKDEGAQVSIVSWTQQYPAIIPREFVDKTSRSSFLEGCLPGEVRVPKAAEATVYARWGDAFAQAMLGLALLGGLAVRRRQRAGT